LRSGRLACLAPAAAKECGVRVGVNFRFARNWSASQSFNCIDNQSNVSVGAYRRILFSATVRFEFR